MTKPDAGGTVLANGAGESAPEVAGQLLRPGRVFRGQSKRLKTRSRFRTIMGLTSDVDYAAGRSSLALGSANTKAATRKRPRNPHDGRHRWRWQANSIMPLLAGRWTWRGAYEILGAATVVAGIIPLFVIGRELGTAPRHRRLTFHYCTWGFVFWAKCPGELRRF